MIEISNYIAKLGPIQTIIVKELRALIKSDFPQFKEEYKWSRPVYTLNDKDIAYILATQQGANFGLVTGAQLDDPKGLLEGTGKDMRHIKIHDLESLDREYIKQLVTQAVNAIQSI